MGDTLEAALVWLLLSPLGVLYSIRRDTEAPLTAFLSLPVATGEVAQYQESVQRVRLEQPAGGKFCEARQRLGMRHEARVPVQGR